MLHIVLKTLKKSKQQSILPITYTLVTKGAVRVSIPLNGEPPLEPTYLAMRPQFLSAYFITPILE